MTAPTTKDELLHRAWGIIANVGGGNWNNETADWQEAAKRWRDAYHADLRNIVNSLPETSSS